MKPKVHISFYSQGSEIKVAPIVTVENTNSVQGQTYISIPMEEDNRKT